MKYYAEITGWGDTINFAGRDVPDLPGHIMLKGDEALTEDDIVKGAKIEIY